MVAIQACAIFVQDVVLVAAFLFCSGLMRQGYFVFIRMCGGSGLPGPAGTLFPLGANIED